MEKKMFAKRGDYNRSWYMVDEQKKLISKPSHSDWCIFDEEGNVALMKGNQILCLSAKWVAQLYINDAKDTIVGWGRPVDIPIANPNANLAVLD